MKNLNNMFRIAFAQCSLVFIFFTEEEEEKRKKENRSEYAKQQEMKTAQRSFQAHRYFID